MKPFDLQKALAGHPVVTKGGRKVIRLAHFPEAKPEYRLQVLLHGDDATTDYREDGTYICRGWENYALFMETKTEKRYARVILDNSGHPMISSVNKLSRTEAEAPNAGTTVLSATEYEVEVP